MMRINNLETKIFKLDGTSQDTEKITIAAQIIREGGVVAFPTETVYGLGANALSEASVEKIFLAKGRPSDNPLIVHIADFNAVEDLAMIEDVRFLDRMSSFWPGAITFVLPKKDCVPAIVSAGLNTVGIRMPANKVALELIRLAGVPIAAPSANLSGKPSPTKASHVIEDLLGKVDAIIDGGDCSVGVESTVLDLSVVPPTILRPGGVTVDEITKVFGEVRWKGSEILKDTEATPKAPGMKYRHYSPKAELIVVTGKDIDNVKHKVRELAEYYSNNGKKVGIMATDENILSFNEFISVSIGSSFKPETIANRLFSILRDFDKTETEIIIAEGIRPDGIGVAVMNRLCKAAGFNVIEV